MKSKYILSESAKAELAQTIYKLIKSNVNKEQIQLYLSRAGITLSNSELNKYIQKYKNEIATNPSTALKAGMGIGALTGVSAMLSAKPTYNIISKLYKQYKWKKDGCEQITDEIKKQECLNYIKQKTINDLSLELKKCTSNECVEKLKGELDKLLLVK